jgi:hypothetical protein
MTLTLPSRPLPSRPVAAPQAVSAKAAAGEQRLRLQSERDSQERRAREAAEAGDVETCARAILAALDCERRLQGSGPQVMQVIKPRN